MGGAITAGGVLGAGCRNPVDRVQRPRAPDHGATLGVSKRRASELIRTARDSGVCDTLLVLLMLELGLRMSEAVGARIEDLSEQGRHRVLRVRGKGQASKATVVPLNPVVVVAVDAACAGRASGPLLVNERGQALSRQQAWRRVRALGEQIGLPELHPHALRHGGVRAGDAGSDPRPAGGRVDRAGVRALRAAATRAPRLRGTGRERAHPRPRAGDHRQPRAAGAQARDPRGLTRTRSRG
jgi:integrase